MKGVNDDEIIDFVYFAKSQGLILRFIEFMKITPLWSEEYFLPIEQVMTICERQFMLERIEPIGSGPAEYYKVGMELQQWDLLKQRRTTVRPVRD